MKVRIGTRRSDLARWQAKHVASLLKEKYPHLDVSFTFVSSHGDRDRKESLNIVGGGVGAFTKESEEALLSGNADIVVHSLKDLPTVLSAGLILAAVPVREKAYDVLCGVAVSELGYGIRVGTGSIRRKAQLLNIFPGIEIRPIRGNVPPRLRKATTKAGMDATILAAAGLERLGLMESAFSILEPRLFPYAVGQGALGIEVRESDIALCELVKGIEDYSSRSQVDAERSLMRRLEAGCSLPVGVVTRVDNDKTLSLYARVTKADGSDRLEDEITGNIRDAENLGIELADRLLAKGAAPMLAEATAIRKEYTN